MKTTLLFALLCTLAICSSASAEKRSNFWTFPLAVCESNGAENTLLYLKHLHIRNGKVTALEYVPESDDKETVLGRYQYNLNFLKAEKRYYRQSKRSNPLARITFLKIIQRTLKDIRQMNEAIAVVSACDF